MKAISNYVVLELDPGDEGKVKLSNGGIIHVDTSWDKYQHSVQEGTVVLAPESLSKIFINAFGRFVKSDRMLLPKKGDRVFFHHMVHRDKMIELPESFMKDLKPSPGKKLYFCEYNNLFFRKNSEKIECFNHFIVLRKVKPGEGGLDELKSDSGLEVANFTQYKDRHGVVVATSELAEEYGLKVGDMVHFEQNSHYWIKVDGEELYRIEFKDIEFVFEKNTNLAV